MDIEEIMSRKSNIRKLDRMAAQRLIKDLEYKKKIKGEIFYTLGLNKGKIRLIMKSQRESKMSQNYLNRIERNIESNKSRAKAREIMSHIKICEKCWSTSHLEVHHKNRNPLDNDKDNLTKICLSCHYEEHKHESIWVIMLRKLNYKLSLAA